MDGVKDAAVFADRIVGKPYLLLDIDREVISRFGLTIGKVQQYIQAAIGGMTMTTTVEGRERYAIRIRYPRALRGDPESLKRVFIPTANGQQIPLGDLVTIRYEQGAQSIKSEDGFLIGYVLFDREKGFSEVEVVHAAQEYLATQIERGILKVPPGISYRFAGNYEQQVRANKRLSIVLPIALAMIFLILYFHFKSVLISAMVFTGVFIAFAGGFIMIGLYDTDWFLNVELFGTNMRDLFQIRTINLSVAVWVGFLALFGIATDDGVLVATFLRDSFLKNKPHTMEGIRDAVVEGGLRRVRPAMMTTATTILALLPVLSSTGRGADIMLPMAIPSFGGMTLQIITMFTVPVLFSLWKESSLGFGKRLKLSRGLTSAILIGIICTMGSSSLSGQSLDELSKEVIEANLDLKILNQEYLAALERAPQVSELPDPELGVGAFPLPVETRLGGQIARISASQMIPWKGTLNKRADLENAKAQVLYEKIDAHRLNLIFQLEKAYYELYEIQQRQNIIRKNLNIFNALEQFALSKVESGKSTAADVLTVQLKLEELNQELAILKSSETGPTATINQLLDRPIATPLTITDTLSIASLLLDRDTLAANIHENHPMIKMFRLQQEVSNKAISLNEIDGKPIFGVGLDYIMVNPRNDATPSHNGRDIVQLRASVKIPIYRRKYDAKKAEENLKIAALENKEANVLSMFQASIEKSFADHEAARLKIDLYRKQIEITQATINILESEYSAKGNNFDELLRLEKELVEYDLKMLKAIVQSHLAKSAIERFIRK